MRWITSIGLVALCASGALAQTSIDGKSLCTKSSGAASGDGWTLNETGYAGTFVKIDKPGPFAVTVDYSTDKPAGAKLSIVVADFKSDGAVESGTAKLSYSHELPAGTYFVRAQLLEPTPRAGTLTINKLTIDSGTVLNESSDANALAASDSYIENFRKGAFVVKAPNIPNGTSAHLVLKKHAFKFGTAVGGFDKNELFVDNAPADSNAAKYQAVIKKEFNAMVPGNAGKWAYNEDMQNSPTMGYIDALIAFAKSNDLTMRMHTLIWNTGQQPKWVISLVDRAAAGDAAAKKELREQISKRIQYFVKDRAANYWAMDILNEPYHQQKYIDAFGTAGIADIYKECGEALKSAGATSTHLCVNEYNILQWSQHFPFKDPYIADPFANWYRDYVEQLQANGAPIGGIGVQYYIDLKPGISQPHNPARAFGALQNLATLGLPLTLTEFGIQTKGDQTTAPQCQDETMRLVFGNPSMDGFIQWGFWSTELWDQATGGAFYDKDWKPTAVYEAWHKRMTEWTTDATVEVKNGSIGFNGFYGDYDVVIDGKTMPLTVIKGTAEYTLGK